MRILKCILPLGVLLAACCSFAGVGADEGTAQSTAEKLPSVPEKTVDKKVEENLKKTKQTKGGQRNREKDADGTEAPDRFEANTVIKSQYKLHGEPLEVDPD